MPSVDSHCILQLVTFIAGVLTQKLFGGGRRKSDL